jgi:lambda family phage portal protein
MARPGIIRRTLNRLMRRSASMDLAGASGRWPKHAALPAPNAQILAARHQQERRSAYLATNDPLGFAAVEAYRSALLGDGPTLRCRHPDPEVRRDIVERWNEWSLSPTVEGCGDLLQVLRLVVSSIVVSGEAVGKMETDSDGTLKLRMLPSEQLDSTRQKPAFALTGLGPGQSYMVDGVEFDAVGRIINYYLRPGPAVDLPWGAAFMSHPHPAEDILHVFDRRTPAQVRGLPWFSASGTSMEEHSQTADAALMKSKVSCLFSGFVVDPQNELGLYSIVGGDDPGPYIDPRSKLFMEPGELTYLPPGTDVRFPNPIDAGSLPDLLRVQQRLIAAGVGLPYENMSGDLSQVNYSSARLGQAAFQRRIKALQSSLLNAQFLIRIYRRWLSLEVLSGRLETGSLDLKPYMNATFLWPAPQPIDPYKSSLADEADLRNRTKSRQQIIAENSGRDISDVDDEIEADEFAPDPAVPAQAPNMNEVQDAA